MSQTPIGAPPLPGEGTGRSRRPRGLEVLTPMIRPGKGPWRRC